MEINTDQQKSFRLIQLFSRIGGMILKPGKEWEKIAHEKPVIAGLIFKYALILALIPSVFIFLYSGIFTANDLFSKLAGLYWGINMAVSNYFASVVTIYFIPFIMNELAPSFGSEKNAGRAVQTVVYSMTAYWLSGFIYQLPGVARYFIIPAAICSIYLIYLGLPFTMKTPKKKLILYVVVTFAITLITASLLFLISRGILGMIFRQSDGFSVKGGMF
jgi:hypothetical protein